MKKISLLTATLLLSVCLFAQTNEGQRDPQRQEVKRERTNVKPQRQEMRKNSQAQQLTEEQRSAIKELQAAMSEENKATANLLREKRAHLTTLKAEDQPDQAAISKTTEEIAALQEQLMKAQVDLRAKISDLMTEEQRAAFMPEQRKGGENKEGRGGREAKTTDERRATRE